MAGSQTSSEFHAKLIRRPLASIYSPRTHFGSRVGPYYVGAKVAAIQPAMDDFVSSLMGNNAPATKQQQKIADTSTQTPPYAASHATSLILRC